MLRIWLFSIAMLIPLTAHAQLGGDSINIQGSTGSGGPTGKQPVSDETKIAVLKKALADVTAENNALRGRSIGETDWANYYYKTYLPRQAEINLDGFEWQQRASQSILWLVIGISMSGVVFSGYQLWTGTRAVRLKSQEGREGSELPGTSFKIARLSVELKTEIIGVIVLVISLCFFYLFIREVYQIKIIGADPTPSGLKVQTPERGGSS